MPHSPWRISRRAMLGGAAGVVGVGAVGVHQGWLPGRAQALRRLGVDGADGVVPEVASGRVVSGEFVSAHRLGSRVGWSVAYPPGSEEDLPVVLVLHGKGGSHRAAFAPDYLGLGAFLADGVRRGAAPFALASIDGGDTYWHPRSSGEDAGAMVTDEFLPLLAKRGLDTRRVGFFGWSMGGFGSLRLAAQLGPARVAGVAVMSPALWETYDSTAPGAFDDAEDFARQNLFPRRGELAGISLRIDCGEGDPFAAATRAYRAGFSPEPVGGLQLGDHDLGYWRRMAPREIAFLARQW